MWFKPAEYQQSNHSAAATTATTATFGLDDAGLSQKSQKSQAVTDSIRNLEQSEPFVKVAEVAKVAAGLTSENRQKLLDYLEAIGETDQDIIDEYLAECGKDAAVLARELQQADDCLQLKTGNTTGLIQCSGCRHLTGDTCQFHDWRVVVDKWRRCSDFEEPRKTAVSALITCKGCSHFQSYNTHGGGAGACSAGVQPFGVCWWTDTAHECARFAQKA